MKFQKGNKLWQNVDPEKVGRPRDFASPLELWKACCEYFQKVDENPIVLKEVTTYDKESEKGTQTKETIKPIPYTWQGLYSSLSVSDLDKYRKERPEFFGIARQIENTIFDQKFSGAAAGVFNANIIARELGLKESVDNTTKLESTNTQYIVSNNELSDDLKDFIEDISNE